MYLFDFFEKYYTHPHSTPPGDNLCYARSPAHYTTMKNHFRKFRSSLTKPCVFLHVFSSLETNLNEKCEK